MSTAEFLLAPPPEEPRRRGLWLQHAAGFVLMEDARRYALAELDTELSDEAKRAAHKAIDDALYGLMMVIDGVTGALANDKLRLDLRVRARLVRTDGDSDAVVQELDLAEGDGMCMAVHGWLKGEFGKDPVAARRSA